MWMCSHSLEGYCLESFNDMRVPIGLTLVVYIAIIDSGSPFRVTLMYVCKFYDTILAYQYSSLIDACDLYQNV